MTEGANLERLAPGPQGHNRLAQGFNPGLAFRVMRPESTSNLARRGAIRRRQSKDCLRSGARRVRTLRDTISPIPRSAAPKSGASFRAHLVKAPNPGLKPW